MTFTLETLQGYSEKNIKTDEECKTFLNALLSLLDQVVNYNEIAQVGLEIFNKNKDNECLKKHLLDTVFSGEDFNVLHYTFCRTLFKNQTLITIPDVHQKLEKIFSDVHEHKLRPPLGPDFLCIVLATPLLFFSNEIKKDFGSDYDKYLQEIKSIHNNSPRIKRIPPQWETPVKIRCECFGLMDGENTFDPDDLKKAVEIAGDPTHIPHVPIY